MSITVSYGKATVLLTPTTFGIKDGKNVENYNAHDLAAAVNAVVRSLGMEHRDFLDLMREDNPTNKEIQQ